MLNDKYTVDCCSKTSISRNDLTVLYLEWFEYTKEKNWWRAYGCVVIKTYSTLTRAWTYWLVPRVLYAASWRRLI